MIDKSFGFDTAVEEAQRAINAAHVEVESVENGVGIVKLMGRYSGEYSCCGLLSFVDMKFKTFFFGTKLCRFHCYDCNFSEP